MDYKKNTRPSGFSITKEIGREVDWKHELNPYSFARILSKEESTQYKERIKKFNNANEKRDFSINYCINNKNKLIELHNKYIVDKTSLEYQKHVNQNAESYRLRYETYVQKTLNYSADKKQFDQLCEKASDIKCEACNAPMRYVSNYNFIGCTNYGDKRYNHSSINEPRLPIEPVNYTLTFDDFINDVFSIPLKYLEDLRKIYNLPRQLMPSVMFEFFYSVWRLERLNPQSTSEMYFIGVKNNQQAKREETIIESVLKQYAKKVISQHVIQYKKNGSDTLYYCIPDFIASSETSVLVLDVKKGLPNSDLKKLQMYHLLIEKILLSKNDNRIVKSYQYFYNGDESVNNKSITLNQLQNEF